VPMPYVQGHSGQAGACKRRVGGCGEQVGARAKTGCVTGSCPKRAAQVIQSGQESRQQETHRY
jgi:hypothetical protein